MTGKGKPFQLIVQYVDMPCQLHNINHLNNIKTMTERNNVRWSTEEDAVLLRYVRNYPHNLHKAFLLVSEQLTDSGTPRTPTGVQAHWYSVLSKKPEALCFFTASAKHVSRNRKNGMGVESTPSIWRRLLNVIRRLN